MDPHILLADINARNAGKSLVTRISSLLPAVKAIGIAIPLTLSSLNAQVPSSAKNNTFVAQAGTAEVAKLPSSNIDTARILNDPNNPDSYQGFDSKATDYFLAQAKKLEKAGPLKIVPYEDSMLGTNSKGIALNSAQGHNIILAVRDTGPEVGATIVKAECLAPIKEAAPRVVVFKDEKIREISFAKASETPSYSDISGDCPTLARFNEAGQVTQIRFGDKETETRVLSYRPDGTLESVESYDKGAGGKTRFDSNGSIDPTSERSVMREAYQTIDSDTFLTNLSHRLTPHGIFAVQLGAPEAAIAVDR